jgi:hypothetical protein
VLGVDVCLGELLVHLTGGGQVPETVIGAAPDTLQADWLGREQDRVVQERKPRGGGEGLQEPGAEHAVVDDGVPAAGQPSRRCLSSHDPGLPAYLLR